MSAQPSRELHEKTLRGFQEGRKWQEFVANHLRRHGIEIEIPEQKDRIKPSTARLHDDPGDLRLPRGGLIEVKAVSMPFTRPGDFPVPEAIVDSVRSYEGKNPKPIAYICVSKPTKAMICLSVRRTRAKWVARNIFDKKKKYWKDFYFCPKGLWEPIENLIVALMPPIILEKPPRAEQT